MLYSLVLYRRVTIIKTVKEQTTIVFIALKWLKKYKIGYQNTTLAA